MGPDVSLSIHDSEVVCLLGDNGAGKSTLTKILSGFHRPSGGEILLDGQPVEFADAREARRGGAGSPPCIRTWDRFH